MRRLLFALTLLATATTAQAQRAFEQAELDALLAPLALYPDPVLSQALIASTYPEEVAQAAAWSRANSYQRGEAAVRAVDGQPWDPSVKAMVAFPELLTRMADNPQWLRDLGEAFRTQEARVMETVQGLRRRAQANGQLASTDQTAVYNQGEAIVVQPRTEIVYVRYYDPFVVYGAWWWPCCYYPVYWRPWVARPVYVSYTYYRGTPDWHRHYVARRNPPPPPSVHHGQQHRPMMPAANGYSHQKQYARAEKGREQRPPPPPQQKQPPQQAQKQPPQQHQPQYQQQHQQQYQHPQQRETRGYERAGERGRRG